MRPPSRSVGKRPVWRAVAAAGVDRAPPTLSLHSRNEGGRIEAVLAALARGEAVALISDAGTPGVYYGQVTTGGTTQAILPSPIASDIGDNVIFKSIIAYKVNDIAMTANGATVSTDTSATIPTVNRIFIGGFEGVSNFLNGHIRQIAYYNTRLPNAQLQTLTAPSLATTLSLSFTNQAYTVGV